MRFQGDWQSESAILWMDSYFPGRSAERICDSLDYIIILYLWIMDYWIIFPGRPAERICDSLDLIIFQGDRQIESAILWIYILFYLVKRGDVVHHFDLPPISAKKGGPSRGGT